MQETYDLQTIIVIFTFLSVLIGVSLIINKKKDFFKSRLNNKSFVNIISTSLLGGGNKIILFEVYDKKYFVLMNKNNISNITLTEESEKNNNSNQPIVVRSKKSV